MRSPKAIAGGVVDRLRGQSATMAPATGPELGEVKLRAIDAACTQFGIRTLADLGGVWAVDGGYSLYAVERHGIDRATIVDEDFTPPLRERSEADSRVQLVHGNFGDRDVAMQVGQVDGILLFDVLLHQVRPDWDDVLALWAPHTRVIVIAGPFLDGEKTIRLPDLGREKFIAMVPDEPLATSVWEHIDEFSGRRGRVWRDVHDIWQWGIVDRDLCATMARLGFELGHSEDAGTWGGLDAFRNRSYVFARSDRPENEPTA